MKIQKHIFFILMAFVLPRTSCYSNKIDSINTKEEVFAFVNSYFNDVKGDGTFYQYYDEPIKVADSLKVKNWVKTDIDNNGETDLLVFNAINLPSIFAVISINGKFIKVIAEYWCKYENIYPVIKNIDNKNVLLLYSQDKDYDNKLEKFIYTELKCDTLTVKDNLFLNYVKFPQKYDIEKIEIANNGLCEGECPVINISIYPKTFVNSCYKQIYQSIYSAQLTENEIKRIVSLLNYSNFSYLKDNYEVNCTDLPTTTLKITYNGGKIKEIRDYGSVGNFTLAEIYNTVYTIKWKKKK